MYIDTHCHLNFKAFDVDLPQVIERARERGVGQIIVPGTDLASSRRAVEIANQYEGVWAAIGIHPHHGKDPQLLINDELKSELSKLASQKRVVAIGEIGLDYHIYRGSKYENIEITPEYKAKQKELFKLQYQLAITNKLPVILHCREAHDDMVKLITGFEEAKNVKINSRTRETKLYQTRPSGVFHCYGGSKKHMRLLITMGYYIGFDGNITYSPNWSQFVSSTPLSHLLLETDSPYLTPEPHRGSRNEPGYLPLVASAVAQYHGVAVEEVARSSFENAKKLFNLPGV
jgi:TatD DNase family protein